MSNLPDDAMAEIFSRVPVDSLVRVKQMCSSWSEIITSDNKLNKPVVLFTFPDRAIVHAMNYKDTDDGLSSSSPFMTSEIEYPFNCSPESKFKLLGSCNGLQCLQVLENGDESGIYGHYSSNVSGICIWNPSKKESKMLPVEPIKSPGDDGMSINCTAMYGFGCNRAMDDYKLLRVVLFDGVDEKKQCQFDPEVKVYNLKTNSWKRLGKLPSWFQFYSVFQNQGFHVEGALHWMAKVVPFELKNPLTVAFGIVSFNIEDEKFRIVPKPSSIGELYGTELVVSGGRLCLLHRPDSDNLEIWEMIDYGVEQSWTKSFRITDPIVLEAWSLKLLSIFNNSECILMTKWENKEVILYNKKTENTRILDLPYMEHKWFHAEMYTDNTSISLKAENSVSQRNGTSELINVNSQSAYGSMFYHCFYFLVVLFLYIYSRY